MSQISKCPKIRAVLSYWEALGEVSEMRYNNLLYSSSKRSYCIIWRNDLLNLKTISNINLHMWLRNWRAILKLNSKLLFAKWEMQILELMIGKSLSAGVTVMKYLHVPYIFKLRHTQQGRKGKSLEVWKEFLVPLTPFICYQSI